LLLGLGPACGREDAAAPEAPPVAPVDRDSWWNEATRRPSGQERILAPRELRALLDQGRRRGFDADPEWWKKRSRWAYERILTVDPLDIEANAGSGRRTLQSIEGFAATWKKMQDARTPNDLIDELLDRYGGWVLDGEPVFLTREEFEVERARLREAARHLARMEGDPEYAAVQRALRHVRHSFHSDYPFFHVRAGPFLVFYTARDLQRDPEADPDEEGRRIATREEYYRRRLEQWTGVYAQLIEDLKTIYPRVWARHGIEQDAVYHQWIFGERAWYADFLEHLRKEEAERPYRTGYFHAATGWAYLYEPTAEGEATAAQESLAETAAYLAAAQILRRWAKDREDPTVNHLDRSRAYWFKEGWPTFLAARRVETSRVGPALGQAKWKLPDLLTVVERRSSIDRKVFLTPQEGDWETVPPPDTGFTDLAWLLVRHLHRKKQAACERFLLSLIEGERRGVGWFEECFEVKGSQGWQALQRAVYAQIE
jgi:hypothetical protein